MINTTIRFSLTTSRLDDKRDEPLAQTYLLEPIQTVVILICPIFCFTSLKSASVNFAARLTIDTQDYNHKLALFSFTQTPKRQISSTPPATTPIF